MLRGYLNKKSCLSFVTSWYQNFGDKFIQATIFFFFFTLQKKEKFFFIIIMFKWETLILRVYTIQLAVIPYQAWTEEPNAHQDTILRLLVIFTMHTQADQ